MNTIKQSITLIVGIVIGYLIANFSSKNINEDIYSTQAKPQYEIKTHVEPTVIASTNNQETNIQATLPVIQNSKNIDDITEITSNLSHRDLENKYQQLNEAYRQSIKKVSNLQMQLDEFDESDITTKQMEALVVEPFKDYASNFSGVMRDEIYNFHQTQEDFDWGYNMQNYISDFILTHYNGNDISLISVVCKHQKCELLVIQNVDESWKIITQDMQQQPWWKFTSTHSSSGNSPGSENNIAFYTFLSV